MKAKHMKRKFASFTEQFDGSTEDACLSWYWKLDKSTGIFEFKDPDAEEEVAEEMGVKIAEGEYVDEDSTGSAKALTPAEIEAVHDHIRDIRNGLKKLNETD
jgi:hypothetical protein